MRCNRINAGTALVPAFFFLLTFAVPEGSGQNSTPVVIEAVSLELLYYADTGDEAHLDRAEALAERMASQGAKGVVSAKPFYMVGQAGGDMGPAESFLADTRDLIAQSNQRATTDSFARLVQDLFARAAATKTPEAYSAAMAATDNLAGARMIKQGNRFVVLPGGSAAEEAGLSDHIETLSALSTAAEATGAPLVTEMARLVGRELVQQFWNDELGQLEPHAVDRTMGGRELVRLLNARGAIALWRAGALSGDHLLTGRAQRVLRGIPVSSGGPMEKAVDPAVTLAKELLTNPAHYLVVASTNEAGGSNDLRREAFQAFSPRSVVLSLDGIRDSDRLAGFGISADVPRAYLCVEDGGCESLPEPLPANLARSR